ncbi:L-cysteine desulfidase family protein [Mailhella sp.]|uniref:L-cysteine desulfidase family protein n=1 Tax=Mailhella sp. TaxID=1981029 RepID=UPI004063EAE6
MDLDIFLRTEVKPALGCTEPGAVALAAAYAGQAHGGPVERLRVALSVNVYKNGRSVMLPNTGGHKGNRLAAMLGALIADPSSGLTVLQGVTPELLDRACTMVEAGAVEEVVESGVPSVWIQVEAEGGGRTALCRISGRHDRVELVKFGDEVLMEAAPLQQEKTGSASSMYEELRSMSFEELWSMAGSISAEAESFLLEGADMNMGVADKGMKTPWGLGVGLSDGRDTDIFARIRHSTGGASDVRMSGGEFPIMSSAGSGNHGITAIIPVAVVADSLGASSRQLAEALALSHLVCGYIKAYTGRLTPICGCSVAAGAGASAGMARLMGSTPEQAERAVVTLVASLLGMICDGAKETCSLKVATAACEAYSAAALAIKGGGVHDVQGMVAPDIKELGGILAQFSQRILGSADSEMAQIMLQHH